METEYPTAQELYEQANEYHCLENKLIRFKKSQQCKRLFDLLKKRSKLGKYMATIQKAFDTELFNTVCKYEEILKTVYGYKVEMDYDYRLRTKFVRIRWM